MDLLSQIDRQLLPSAAPLRAPTSSTLPATSTGSEEITGDAVSNQPSASHSDVAGDADLHRTLGPVDLKTCHKVIDPPEKHLILTAKKKDPSAKMPITAPHKPRESSKTQAPENKAEAKPKTDIYELLDLKPTSQGHCAEKASGGGEVKGLDTNNTTALRGELDSREHIAVDSTEPRGSMTTHRRVGSGRTTGLRGELGSGSVPGSRGLSRQGSSGRTTGLRGELAQQQEPSGEETNLEIEPFGRDVIDDSLLAGESYDEGLYSPRVKTAVLAQGNRPLLLGHSGSDTCLLPEVTSDTTQEPLVSKVLHESYVFCLSMLLSICLCCCLSQHLL